MSRSHEILTEHASFWTLTDWFDEDAVLEGTGPDFAMFSHGTWIKWCRATVHDAWKVINALADELDKQEV